jgi:hypothetical protein
MTASDLRRTHLALGALLAVLAGCPASKDAPGDPCAGVTCDDGNPCTDDACVDGACQFVDNTASCDDGNACTTLDTCSGGACHGAAVACDDASLCTTDTCDPIEGCLHAPVDCDDGDACTVESCDPATGCAHAPLDCPPRPNDQCWDAPTCDAAVGCAQHRRPTGTPCEDGNACTTGDACDDSGACVPSGSVTCTPPGNSACYVARSCDPVTGCAFDFAPPSTACDDGDKCTSGDACDGAGHCAGTPVTCTAALCHVATCNPTTGACDAVPATDGTACDDQNLCTTSDHCAGGLCVGGTLPCDDGDPCNGTEACDAATGCVAGTPPTCSDGDLCTTDHCEPFLGCEHVAKDCSDGDACTADTCSPATGTCLHPAVSCDDGNACTAESCDPVVGCAHTPISCDDGRVCTSDSCNPASGCTFTPRSAATLCAPPTCSGNSSVAASYCDGVGGCATPAPVSCGAYTCNPASGTCRTSCATSADCVGPYFCDATNHCVAKLLNGAACIDAAACQSGYCVDGTCCDVGCAGTCMACNQPGSVGVCTPIPAGQDPSTECPGSTCSGGPSCL